MRTFGCRCVVLMVLVLLIVSGISLTSGCSSNHSTLARGGSANNGLLKGNYTYSLGGTYSGIDTGSCSYCSNGAYQRSGTFIADGNGHITSGNDEYVQGATPVIHSLTGTYTIANDGTGILMLSIGNQQVQLAFVIGSDSSLSWIEFDSFGTAAGGARAQNAALLGAPPNGTFVFRVHSSEPNSGSPGSVSTVGLITINNGIISGREDQVRQNVFGSATLAGTISRPNAAGMGTLTLTDSDSITSSYVYYIIDASTLNLMETDFDEVNGKPRFGVGRAEAQTGASFDNASLNGGVAFSSSGETLSTPFSIVTVGVLVVDGNGNITGGSYDSVSGGTPITNVPVTGNYSVSPAGRVSLVLNTQTPGLASIPEIAWLVNPSRALFLVNVAGRAEDGILNLQQNTPFSQASLNGSFVFSTFGGDDKSPSQVTRVGLASFDGQSNVTLVNYFVNRGGSLNQTNTAPVSYSVTPNGRVTSSIPGLTSSLVMYLTSGSSTSLLFEDPQSAIGGSMTQQQTSP